MADLNNIKNAASKLFKKGSLKVKKYSPEIALGVGIISGIGAAVTAYNTRPKIELVLEEAQEKKDIITEYVEENGYTEEYTKEDHNKDLALIFVQTGVKVIKEFAPAIGLATLSIVSILTSHNILKKRNAALAAAYQLAHNGFKIYRNRVVERFGEDIDKELRYGVKEIEHEEKVVDKNGKEKIKKTKETTIENPNETTYSSLARCFDASSPFWSKDPYYNKNFLMIQQRNANDKLIADGFLFLNDVYEMLGFEKTSAGQYIGWIYDPDGTKHGDKWPKDVHWDNCVDFGIFDVSLEANRRFINEYEPCFFLDFNVDGCIIDLI